MHTLDQWKNFVAGGTRGLSCEEISAAAKIAHDAESRGQMVSAWHAASIVTNTLDRCSCVPCRLARSLPHITV